MAEALSEVRDGMRIEWDVLGDPQRAHQGLHDLRRR
jgi:hypothetical protein